MDCVRDEWIIPTEDRLQGREVVAIVRHRGSGEWRSNLQSDAVAGSSFPPGAVWLIRREDSDGARVDRPRETRATAPAKLETIRSNGN
jgi:hypothetical protein